MPKIQFQKAVRLSCMPKHTMHPAAAVIITAMSLAAVRRLLLMPPN